MYSNEYSRLVTDNATELKCKTYNFTVPTIWPLWVLLILAVIAIVINYLFLFRVIPGRPTENYTNSDYYNENNYYKQYQ